MASTFKFWSVILNVKNGLNESAVADSLNPNSVFNTIIANEQKLAIERFYLIKHDRDILEDKKPKTVHFHLMIENSAKKGFKTQLQALEEVFGKCYIIQLEAVNNFNKAVRYLTHIDHPEKAQYEIDQILTNDIKVQRYFVDVQEAVKLCDTMSDLIDTIGLDQANKYRGLFKDLREEKKSNLVNLLKSQVEIETKLMEYEELFLKYQKVFADLNELAVINNYGELAKYLQKNKL